MSKPIVNTSPVNSFNEWGPLEEVIIGVAHNACEPALTADPVWQYLFHSKEKSLSKKGPYPQDLIDQGNRELDNLSRVLANEGVTVRRPTPMSFSEGFKTPAFEVPNSFNCTCPRDVLMVCGNEIMEAPMALRSRFFEFHCLRPLIMEYFRAGALWTAAPKAMMGPELYRTDYPMEAYGPERKAAIEAHQYVTTEFEPIWDAADFMRFGKDIFGQRSFVTNEFGIEWVRRHLEPKGFRVHTLHSEDVVPKHIDCTLVPLRPGLALENPTRKMEQRGLFAQNGWELLSCVPPNGIEEKFASRVIRPTSTWIGMNILSVDDRRIIVGEKENDIANMLESQGFKTIRVPFGAMYYLGGAFHCATTDVRRRSQLESYFPEFDAHEEVAKENAKYTNTIGV